MKSVLLYSLGDPDVIYRSINIVCAKEALPQFPLFYTVINLIDIAIQNFYDRNGSLGLNHHYKNELRNFID